MGTREEHRGAKAWDKDHPHAYGDKNEFAITEKLLQGSSPRVWGQGVVVVAQRAVIRIIPTRMGTS